MIKNRLKALLNAKNISVVQLAKDTGLNRNAIYNFMGNHQQTYKLDTMNTICNYLNMNISDIIYYSEDDMTFDFDKDFLNISFNKININNVPSNVCIFRCYIDCYKNNKVASGIYLTSYFFVKNGIYYFGYETHNMTGYKVSMISNKNNIVKIVKDAIKYIISYTEGIQFAKQQFSSNNDPFSNIPNKIINQYLGFSKNKEYLLNIIPLFDFFDTLSELNDFALPSIKVKIKGSNDNNFSLTNIKNNKTYIHGINTTISNKTKITVSKS